MVESELITEMEKLIERFESANDGWPIGCYLELGGNNNTPRRLLEWDGEKMSSREGELSIKKQGDHLPAREASC